MIKDSNLWSAWEDEQSRRESLELPQKLQLLDAMYELALALGVFPPEDPLEGLETDIRVARILNNLPSAHGSEQD
jgi:hypothetical protein